MRGFNILAYINRKEEQYEDNTITNMDNRTLMSVALEKYKTMVAKGAWMQKSKEELEFIALKNELELARKQLVQKPLKQQGNTKKADKGGPKNDGEWAWKSIAPKAGELHHKKFRGKDYIYCPHHGDTKWVLKVNLQGVDHATGCRAKNKPNGSAGMTATTGGSTATGTPTKTPTKRDVVIARALANVMMDEDLSAITEDENIAGPEKE
jgi:hypothetical protein